MAKANEDRFGVEALLSRLRELRSAATADDKARLIGDLRSDATAQHTHMHGMIIDGRYLRTQATVVGRLWGAATLADLEVIWGGWRTIVPPGRHTRGDLTKSKRTTTWMVDAALSWPREQVDELDRELFELATAANDQAEAAEVLMLRGSLEVAAAWRAEVTVDDRHVVPVSPDPTPALLFESPPCLGYRGGLGRRVRAMLWEAENDVEQALKGSGRARDRLRAADMATGRAQACRQVLSLLRQPIDDNADADHEGLGEKCEGCTAEAVTRDSDGIGLCRACYDALPTIDDKADGHDDTTAYKDGGSDDQ